MRSLFALLSFFCFSLVTFQLSAQRQNVYYFTKDNYPTKSIDSMDYFRIVREPDSGSVLFSVMEYYKNKQIKFVGHSSTINPLTYEGQAVWYYPNGKRNMIAECHKGALINTCYSYYPNGVIHMVEQYPDKSAAMPASMLSLKRIAINFDAYQPTGIVPFYQGYDIPVSRQKRIIRLNDTTGKALVVDGNGHYINQSKDENPLYEEGNIVDGYKDGKWQGHHSKSGVTYIEKYNKGKLIAGTCKTPQGETYDYTTIQQWPKCMNGKRGVDEFIDRNLVFPEKTRHKDYKGRVTVKFVVTHTGEITQVMAINSSDKELNAEAVRVVELLPRMIPGIINGEPAAFEIEIPVYFDYRFRRNF